MPGNEHDPLDSWLGQQVRPMPPPPGTFELITRRARRRKIRKLAVTVVSAAAVAAGAAVAVPNVIALEVTPIPVAQANGQSSATPGNGGTPSTNGSGSPVPSPQPSTGPASGLAAPAGPVPANFQPTSVTFDSKTAGWVIGQAGTPGHCADKNPYICTSIVRTPDAGKTWYGGPAPKTGAPAGPSGVSGIRFLDGVNGWAFGPELWSTHDKGNTWNKVAAADGSRVTDLETVNHRAYALFASQCSGVSGADFAVDCTSYALFTTTADSDNWVPVGGSTNGLTDAGAPTSAVLAVTDATGYLVAPDGTLYSGPVGRRGAWSKQGTVACQPGPAQANGLPSRVLLALQSSTQLAVACMGPSFGGVTIFTSSNSGATWTQQPATAWSGVTRPTAATSLADAVNGTLVLATRNGLDVLPAGTSQWERATVQPAEPGGGFIYVGMTDWDQGVAVAADAGRHEIWMTFDGAKTWAPATKIAPPGS